MTTSPFLTATRFITSYTCFACCSFRCWKRKLAFTAVLMRSRSAADLGTTSMTQSPVSSSSAAVEETAIAICCSSP